MALDQFVAKRIQTMRKDFHLTQEQLAEAASLDVSSIAKIERGERSNIKINTLEKIVDAFGLSMSSFFKVSKATKEIDALDLELKRFKITLSQIPDEKRQEYLKLFEAIVKIEN